MDNRELLKRLRTLEKELINARIENTNLFRLEDCLDELIADVKEELGEK